MYRAYEATVDPSGHVQLSEAVQLPGVRRALVIVLEDAAIQAVDETALLSEGSLAAGWNRPEEDAAWAYLQSEK